MLWVVDASTIEPSGSGPGAGSLEVPPGTAIWFVVNKIDLVADGPSGKELNLQFD